MADIHFRYGAAAKGSQNAKGGEEVAGERAEPGACDCCLGSQEDVDALIDIVELQGKYIAALEKIIRMIEKGSNPYVYTPYTVTWGTTAANESKPFTFG